MDDNNIVGTWRLVETAAHDDNGNAMHPPYGDKPRGLLIFYPDKRMMSVLCDSRARLSDGETVREYNSYCGNYEFDGKTLVTHVDASANLERVAAIKRASFLSKTATLCSDKSRVLGTGCCSIESSVGNASPMRR